MPNAKIIEPIISFSILIIAIENLFQNKVNSRRLIVIFIFGLFHGMGFANALQENGLASQHFITSLLSFIIGVELGQITVIIIAYFLITKWFSNKEYYYSKIVYPLSSIIAIVAVHWTIDRILN